MKINDCPLCKSHNTILYLDLTHHKLGRLYHECRNCSLVFADNSLRLAPEEEKGRYATHTNNPQEKGYRAFLDKLLVPLQTFLKNEMKGLDFGCGPGPTISVMMAERGFEMNNYDPFFHDDRDVLTQKYDFITCTEVIEHMFRPMVEMKLLKSLLNENGVIGLMTEFVPDKEKFVNWYYKNDPTHVCFYSPQAFQWMAKELKCDLEVVGNSVVILSRFKED